MHVSTRTVKSLTGRKNLLSLLRNEIINRTFIARDQWGAHIMTTSGQFICWVRSRDSTVTRLWARRSWVLVSAGVRIPSLFQTVQVGLDGHPNSYSVGAWGSFVGGKVAGACTCAPISTSFQIKNTCSCTSSPHICPYVVHRNNCTFYLFVLWIYGWIKMTTSTKLLRMWEVHVSNLDPGTGHNKKNLISQFLSLLSFTSRRSDVTTVFLLMFAYSLFTNCFVF
jgi:hypothetical protein